MSERELQSAVVSLAQARGWLVHHTRASLRADGTWRTAVQGSAGFPDLVLARPYEKHVEGRMLGREILFVELKADKGRVSTEQQAWLDALGSHACVWRPAQWFDGTVERTLR